MRKNVLAMILLTSIYFMEAKLDYICAQLLSEGFNIWPVPSLLSCGWKPLILLSCTSAAAASPEGRMAASFYRLHDMGPSDWCGGGVLFFLKNFFFFVKII